jgi:hypothetical protein
MNDPGAFVMLPVLPSGYSCGFMDKDGNPYIPAPGLGGSLFFAVSGSPYSVSCSGGGDGAPCTFTITVNPTCPQTCVPTAIEMDCPGPLGPYQCLSEVLAPETLPWQDNCGNIGLATATVTQSNPGSSCNNSITQTWVAVSGTVTQTCTRVIEVNDTTPPNLVKCPTGTYLGCNPAGGLPTCYSVKAGVQTLDNCNGPVTLTCVQSDSDQNCIHTREFTIFASDGCNNTNPVPCVVTFTWKVDITKPTLLAVLPAVVNVQCVADIPPKATPTANDNCDGPLSVSYAESIVGSTCNQTITRTWWAIDSCGNGSTNVQTIYVKDTTAPAITCLPNKTNECAGVALAFDTPGFSDNCDPAPILAIVKTVTNLTCGNTFVACRTWSVTDSCGNSNTCSQTIATVDTTRPSVTTPTGSDLGCNPTTVPTDTGIKGGVTATDTCGTTYVTVTHVDGGTACASNRTFNISVADNCGNVSNAPPVVFTWRVDTTRPTFSGLPPASTNYQCLAAVPTAPTVAANDNCDGSRTVTYTETQSNPGSSCTNTITRKWSASDTCGNSTNFTQTIFVNDNTPPLLTLSNASINVNCATFTPFVTETVLTQAQWQALGISATDTNCGNLVVKVIDSAPTGDCPKVYKRTFKAADLCGNSVQQTQTVYCLCQVLMTDSLLCTLPLDYCGTAGFRLLFTQDPQNFPCYKLTASNPGQFYYNAFYFGTPGTTQTFTITLPYPWVSQGAQPIHAYDSVAVSTSSAGACLTPGTAILVQSNQVTLANYSPQAFTSTTTVTVTVVVPASGFIYLNMHLDYGLKGSTGYTKNLNSDAISCTTTNILVPNPMNYTFLLSGSLIGSSTATSCNTFKKNPGVGGLVTSTSSTYSVPNANAVLKDAKGTLLASALTDEDGWYILNYKYTGKATTFYVTVTPPGTGAKPITQSVTLKANGYAEIDFAAP